MIVAEPVAPREQLVGAAGTPPVTWRAVMTYDLGTYIPSGVTIDLIRMDLVLGVIAGSGMGGTGSNLPSRTIRVYHLNTAWNEGSSGTPTSQTIGGTGGGYTISTGDTSWHYTNYNGSTWSNLGGDFNSTEIANATFTTPFTVGQTCSWSSAGRVSNLSLQPILHIEWH